MRGRIALEAPINQKLVEECLVISTSMDVAQHNPHAWSICKHNVIMHIGLALSASPLHSLWLVSTFSIFKVINSCLHWPCPQDFDSIACVLDWMSEPQVQVIGVLDHGHATKFYEGCRIGP